MIKEFKEFAMRGNVLDMAVGIIIGAAFGQIVTSFVQDIMMPPIGRLLGHVDFSNLVRQPDRDALRHDRGGQGGRRGDAELRPLPEHGHQFPDRGVCGVPAGAPGQSLRGRSRLRRRAYDSRLPVLPERRAAQGDEVHALHVRASRRVRSMRECILARVQLRQPILPNESALARTSPRRRLSAENPARMASFDPSYFW